MADAPENSPEARAHRRGLKFRKREDHAVELFQEALGKLEDIARVDRILLELGRFYNPILNAPIVDLSTRRQIVEALQGADVVEARRLIEERLRLYARVESAEPEGPSPP
jgi:hypothetical protein